jgi:tetratricopeptide (TPR) repeat protein
MDGQLLGRAADVYLMRNQKEKAANLYEKAGQHDKAAQLYLEKRDFERAEANLSKVGKDEQMAELYEQMGSKLLAANAYLKNGRVRKAVQLFSEQKEFKTAAETLKKIYDDPNTLYTKELGFSSRSEIAKQCGEYYIQANKFEEAAKLLIAEKLFKEAGDAYARGKEFEKAIEAYNRGDHFAAAAQIYYQLGRHQQGALLEAEGFIRDGKDEQAAQAYIKAGDYAKAGDVFRNMQENLKAGEMYEKAREYALAGSMYSDAEQFERAGVMFEKAKRLDEAIEMYGKAGNEARQVAILEKMGRYFEAAENYYKRNLGDEALQMLMKIQATDADYRQACGLEGKILMEQGKLTAAKSKLEEAISEIKNISGANIGTIFNLAKVTEKLGGESKALFTIEKMLAEDFFQKQGDKSVEAGEVLDDMKRKLGTLITKASRRSTGMKTPEFADAQAMPLSAGGTDERGGTVPQTKRYVPIKEIGKGGMGIVYTARDSVLDRIVALKLLPANLKKNQQAVNTFMREAKSAASLNHKNIVTVHDAGIQDGEYYIAMELIDGKTIKEIIKQNKRLSLKSIYAVLKQLLEGLSFAHKRKIVHRDLTTNNIMWSRDKLVKIMDFGLAKVVRDLQSEQSIIGGTPSYMSPEQTLGNPIDMRTDLYSLGVCLFEMGTGELPFKKGNLGYHHVHTAAPDPTTINPALPDALASLILKCMEKDPNKRPQTVEEIYDWLSSEAEFSSAQ